LADAIPECDAAKEAGNPVALAIICRKGYILSVAWSVEGTDEFRDWFVSLDDDEQRAVIRSVDLLEEFGPRTLYVFDPRRVAILLIGGDKTGDINWYDRTIPIADRLYKTYLEELEHEGLI
jgi:hypothetical protein